MHPTIDRMLAPTDIEPTPFRNSTSKVAGLYVHAVNNHSGEISVI